MSCNYNFNNQPIDYLNFQSETVCDHAGCTKIIHRKVIHACGGVHGSNEVSCNKYFCDEHLLMVKNEEGQFIQLCIDCANRKD